MAKETKMNRNNKPAAVKVVKEGMIQRDINADESARYVFWSTKNRRVAAGATFEAALRAGGMRGYRLKVAA